jgi:hypothetical protein
MTWQDHEIEVLVGICRTRNRCEEIAADLVSEPLKVYNARGELITHPLIVEERMQWAHLGRLIAQLRMPDKDGNRGQRRGGYRRPYGSQN